MKRARLDNHILIWGVRGVATPGQEEMINRAQGLFEDLDAADADIVVPAAVVAEFLAGVPKPQHVGLLDVLNRRLQVVPFDVRTAAIGAELWRDGISASPPTSPARRQTKFARRISFRWGKVSRSSRRFRKPSSWTRRTS